MKIPIFVLILFINHHYLVESTKLFELIKRSNKIARSTVDKSSASINYSNRFPSEPAPFIEKVSKSVDQLYSQPKTLNKLSKSDANVAMIDELDRMLSDDELNGAFEDHKRTNDILSDEASVDLIESSEQEAIFNENLQFKQCSESKCKSVKLNVTNMNYAFHESRNHDCDCFFCQQDYVLIRSKRKCVGPCKDKQDCERLRRIHDTPVDCSSHYGYRSDDKLGLCMHDGPVKKNKTLAISIFDRELKNQTVHTGSNRTFLHQINHSNVCQFEMKVDKLIDTESSNDQSNPFVMELSNKTVNIYLNSNSTLKIAQITINCRYKEFYILHSSELHFKRTI